MNKILQVAAREFSETVRTKTFLIGSIILPMVMFGVMFFIQRATERKISGPRPDRQVAVINRESRLAPELEKSFDNFNRNNPQRRLIPHFLNDGDEEELKQSVRDGDFVALLVVEPEVVAGAGKVRLYTYSSNDMALPSQLRQVVERAATNTRYLERGLSPELIAELRRGIEFEDYDLAAGEQNKANRVANMMAPFFFLMLMFFGIMFSSMGLLTSIIEEKTSRIIEVLLSAVSPFELMAGKIAGLSLAGLIVVAVYGSGGLIAANKFGVTGLISVELAALFIVYFIFCFVLLSAIFTAIGSMCNNIREAQNYNSPIMIMMMIPIFSWSLISEDPNGTLAVALSFIPPITPFVMVLRIATLPQVPWLQVALTLVLLVVSVPAVVWVCARIFRTGILMYGKPPSPVEIFRWVRQS